MKDKLKIIFPAGLIALALICVIAVRQGDPGTEKGENQTTLGAQQTLSAEETPNDLIMTTVPEVTLPPIITPPAKASATPGTELDGSSAGETVTTKPDGTIVITPDWQEQIEKASGIVTPESQVTANMGSGGGDLELGKDGAFHGDNPPTATPAPIQTPAPTVRPTPALVATPPATTTTAPGGLVKPGKPETTKDPTEVTPSPDPTQGAQEGGTKPPSYNGHYDGEISPDGLYGWIGGFGWIKMGGSDGGTSGQFGSDGDTLSGNKVGNM